MEELYLQHHGVLGQKWGVRRYQNYDGSYTRAGMKRYNSSLESYKQADSDYKESKKIYKNAKRAERKGVQVKYTSEGKELKNVTSKDVKRITKELRSDRNAAKKQLDKDYKHLKQDKLADKGKERYAKGETITGNSNTTYTMGTLAAFASAGSNYLSKSGIIDQKYANAITTAGGVLTGATFVKEYLIDPHKNKQLRAYYGHTSNY